MTTSLPLKPDQSRFTDSQWQAIYDHGTNLLVSASAGSGKTTVLVERVIEKIKSGINIDELLIVTFTESAAKEMKERIQLALQAALNQEADRQKRQFLTRQLQLLPTASISTLHAFCLQVIRRYYYLIHLDPVFRLLTDDTEALLLKEDVWEEVREELYNQPDFYQLAENFSSDRSDEGLTQLIFSLYEFARTNPNPNQWLADLADNYKVEEDIAHSKLYQEILKPQMLARLAACFERFEEMLRLANVEELTATQEFILAEKEKFEELSCLLKQDDLNAAYTFIEEWTFARFVGAKRSASDEIKALAQQIKSLREQNKNVITAFKKQLFALPPEKHMELMEKAGKLVQQMAQVTERFAAAYLEEKFQRNLLDFNDLEHFTLQILAHYQEGEWQASEAAEFYRAKFKEVLVDEYQDINQLQATILSWLAQPETTNGNLFMVGDMKQSIYSFRLADPTLFLEKYQQYADEKGGRRIILAENFRSRANVLAFTNLLFSQLMDLEVGQMEYDGAAALVQGNHTFPDEEQAQTEILIYETAALEESTSIPDNLQFDLEDRTVGELQMVAHKIHDLIANGQLIYDKKLGTTRPIEYRDIVLLTPTKKNNLVLLDVFDAQGIPLQVNDAQNYFQATEIKIMLALLTVIDNPYQDIPFAAVLRSPVVGLRENDLAILRIHQKTGAFYQAFVHFSEIDPVDLQENERALQQKIKAFQQQFNRWRADARRKPIGQFIWQIYEETGLLDYVNGLPSGKQRQANLYTLAERASSYEEMSYKGLFQFVRFVEKMQAKDQDLAKPTMLSDDQNAVRVMTIHASKGLEFPVVFILDLTKQFNLQDIQQRYIFDEKFGVGIQYNDSEKRTSYPTLPLLALREIKRKKLLSEEMRKLYVALTRAEEKLFLVGSYKNEQAAWDEWNQAAHEAKLVLGEALRLESSNMMKWIGMSLVRHPDAKGNSAAPTSLGDLEKFGAHFSISFFKPSDLQVNEASNSVSEQSVLELPEGTFKQLEQRLDFKYPYVAATHTTNYQSVSELKGYFQDPELQNAGNLELENQAKTMIHRFVQEEWSQPQFLQTAATTITPAEVGTATHLVMQRLTLSQKPTLESLQEIVQELVAEQMITEAVAKKIRLQDILAFFQTDLGKRLLQNAALVKREVSFSLLIEARKLFQDYPQNVTDKILVHGVMDGYLEQKEEVILYDFKTDYLGEDPSEQMLTKIIDKYRGQLNLYRAALEEMTGKPVTAAYLCFLRARQIIEVTTEQLKK